VINDNSLQKSTIRQRTKGQYSNMGNKVSLYTSKQYVHRHRLT